MARSRLFNASISSRIWQLAILACCALLALGLILAWTVERTHESGARVQHTLDVRKALADYTRELVAAESGQRGYLLTQQDVYLAPYEQVLADNKASLATLSELIGDGPEQPKLRRLADIFDGKLQELSRTIGLAQAGNMKGALAIVREGSGRRYTLDFQRVGREISDDEIDLLAKRQAAAESDNRDVLIFTGIGGLLALILILAAAKRTIARISERLNEVKRGIAAFANGEFDRRVEGRCRDEIGTVAVALNGMADHIVESNLARKVSDDTLKDSEARLRSILSAVPDAIYKFDEFGTIVYFSAAATRLFGYSENEICGQNVRILVAQPFRDLHNAFLTHLRETGEQRTATPGRMARAQRKDGTTFPMEWTLVEVSHGTRRLFTGFVRDITERQRAEVELLDAKVLAETANLAKSEFLSSMSHELRTPLNAILGFAQLMETDKPAPSANQAASIAQILEAGWYLLDLVNKVLDLSLIESGKLTLSLEPVALSEVLADCREAMEPLAQKRGIAMTFPAFAKPCFVYADAMRLKQVFAALISNAIKYNRPEGSIVIQCRAQTDSRVRVSVADTGMGLTAEMLALLYRPFNRLGHEAGVEQGTGIGLVVTKRLVEEMHGAVGVESEVGTGTVFWVDLMAVSAAEFALADIAGRSPADEANALPPVSTVLYVEDNPANLRLVEMLIARRPNMRLLSASTGDVGVDLAQVHHPDAILMDINLPGMNGYSALAVLRAVSATADIPVIALSAKASPRDIERGIAAGFFRYLTKPIDVDELMATLDMALAVAPPPAAITRAA
jgi:PAS domain S-box-containing protein